MRPDLEIWLAAGIRTPFARSDGPLSRFDAIELSVPVARCMLDQLDGLGHRRAEPDLEQHRPGGSDGCWLANDYSSLLNYSGLLNQHDRRDRGRGHDQRRRPQPRACGGRRCAQQNPFGPRSALVRLDRQIPPTAFPRAEGIHLVAVKPRDLRIYVPKNGRESHERAEHGRAHRDHGQGVGDLARGSGSAGSRGPSARHRSMGTAASLTTSSFRSALPHQGARRRRVRPTKSRRRGTPRRVPARALEPEWRQRCSRSPVRRDRSAYPEPGGERTRRETLGRSRRCQHLCRWRPGVGRSSRGGLTLPHVQGSHLLILDLGFQSQVSINDVTVWLRTCSIKGLRRRLISASSDPACPRENGWLVGPP